MARSQLKNTRGLNIRPAKKRDKTARASVRIEQNKDGTSTVIKKDDGKPTVTYVSRDKNPKKLGYRVTTDSKGNKKTTKVLVDNPNYNKKKKPKTYHSEKARNPGGGIGSRFIGKRERMWTDDARREGKKYNK